MLVPAAGIEIYGVVLDSLHQRLIGMRKHNLVDSEALVEAFSSHEWISSAAATGGCRCREVVMADPLRGVLGFGQTGAKRRCRAASARPGPGRPRGRMHAGLGCPSIWRDRQALRQ